MLLFWLLSNKPGTQRQFQSGWKQFGNYLARNHFRHEDVKVATVANFMGRQFIDHNLATSTVLNHFYACKKPFKAKFKLSLDSDENIMDLISAMKKVRPGRRGASVFPKWSLQGLLNYLNSAAFEPLEDASFNIVRSKLLTLICLNTGRRVNEVAAIAGYDFHRDDVVFSWPPGSGKNGEGS